MKLSPEVIRTISILAFYLITGTLSTILNQYLCNEGLTGIFYRIYHLDQRSLIVPAVIYYGYLFVNCVPKKFMALSSANPIDALHVKDRYRWKDLNWNLLSTVHGCIILNSIIDFTANTFCILGISKVGSGLFQIIYSSVPIWTALESRLFMGKKLTLKQWIGIITVTAGLGLTSVQSNLNGGNHFVGIFFCLMGAITYALVYVLGEYIQTIETVNPQDICLKTGQYCCSFHVFYLIVYVIPNYDEIIVKNVRIAHGTAIAIILFYIFAVFNQTVHGLSYYMSLGQVGSVTTATMNGLRAILVFVSSSILFCRTDSNQCITTIKELCSLIVLSGLAVYIYETNRIEKQNQILSESPCVIDHNNDYNYVYRRVSKSLL